MQVGEAELLVALGAHGLRTLRALVRLGREPLGLELALLRVGLGHLGLGARAGRLGLLLPQAPVVLGGRLADLGRLRAMSRLLPA